MIRNFFEKTYHRILLERLLIKNRRRIVGRVLDIGSKNRRYDHLFEADIVAVDKVPNESQGVIYGDIEKGLAFSPESFNNVLCLEVFEYLDDYKKAVLEIHRLLKRGGCLFISAPFMYPDHRDSIRLTKDYFLAQFYGFSSVEIFLIGNSATIVWDIVRKKCVTSSNKHIRFLSFLFISPLLLLIKLGRLDRSKDSNYYSGIFVIAKK